MLNDNDSPRRNPNEREGMGAMMVIALAALVILAGVFFWAPWKDTRTTDNASPGTTVGSSTNRPAAPASPAAPAPSPSPNR
jgi:hypothetical protein